MRRPIDGAFRSYSVHVVGTLVCESDLLKQIDLQRDPMRQRRLRHCNLQEAMAFCSGATQVSFGFAIANTNFIPKET